jgi:hypothetical protein
MTRAGEFAGADPPDDGLTTEFLAARLSKLDRLVRQAPPELFQAYARIPEARLADGLEARVAALETEQWSWSVHAAADPVEALFPAALEVRATDALLRRVRPREAPVNADRDYAAPGEEVLVVPCRERRLGAGGRDRQGYERRGVLKHRILPRRVGRYEVRLFGGGSVPLAAPVGPPPFRGGAALFENLDLQIVHPASGTFLVEGVDASDLDGQVDRCLGAAHRQACSALVWPELTIDPRRRERIGAWLANRLFEEAADGARLDLVIPGSWHDRASDAAVNRSVVLDGDGRELLAYEKLFGLHVPEYGSEAIRASRTLHVLVLEDLLVGFGICRDFAEGSAENPFPNLDVDLFLAPSLGNATTLEGHVTTARVMASRFATRAFVVQQGFPPTKDGVRGGVVCGATAAPQSDEFVVYKA